MKITLRPEGATDSSTDVVLSDGADTALDNVRGPAMGSNSVSISSQQINAIRGLTALFINRENRAGSYSFRTSRRFASLADAGRWMLTHGMTCPAAGTLMFDFGDTAQPTHGKLAVFFGCVLQRIGEFEQIGVTIRTSYACVYQLAAEVLAEDLSTEIVSHRRNVTPTEPTAEPETILINCGGWAETGWEADRGFSGTTATDSTSAEITGALSVPQGVYQSRRTGTAFEYNIPLTAGQYSIRLHFCEIVATEAAVNLLTVAVNGVALLEDFDVFTAAGDKDIAHIAGLENITIVDNLQLEFSTSDGVAQISGIEIFPYIAPEE
jgi:hypothetical protein